MTATRKQLSEATEQAEEEAGRKDYEIKILKDDLATAKFAAQVNGSFL